MEEEQLNNETVMKQLNEMTLLDWYGGATAGERESSEAEPTVSGPDRFDAAAAGDSGF